MTFDIILGIIITVILLVIAIVIACVVIIKKVNLPKSQDTYRNRRPVPISKKEMIGEIGEILVSRVLGETVKGEQYVINGFLIGDSSGHSCEIDHIVINQFGIWVIETKNINASIYGNENDKTWNFVFPSGQAESWDNPIRQNNSHIYALTQCLNVKYIFHNVVVFVNGNFSNVQSDKVCNYKDLPSIINTDKGIHLSLDDMERYYDKLTELLKTYSIKKDEHLKNISNRQRCIEQGICPECGGKIVLKEGRYGQFYGCSNYPECKFKMNKD